MLGATIITHGLHKSREKGGQIWTKTPTRRAPTSYKCDDGGPYEMALFAWGYNLQSYF